MKKMERKENANKGFSLVELIVVVAIMAVLVGILAPQYLRYVEKTRAQKDVSAAEEVRHAVEIALADETINNGLTSNPATVLVQNGDGTTPYVVTSESTDAYLVKELKNVTGTVTFTSNAHKGQNYKITITKNGDSVEVKGEWENKPATP